MDMNKLWEENEKTINYLSGSFWNSYPKIDKEEYRDNAIDCFIRCCERYQEESNNGACFNTYLHTSIKQYFKGMIVNHSQQQHDITEYSEEQAINKLSPEKMVAFKNQLECLSQDAINVINHILFAADEVNNTGRYAATHASITKGELRKKLQKKWFGRGGQKRVNKAFKEIKSAMA